MSKIFKQKFLVFVKNVLNFILAFKFNMCISLTKLHCLKPFKLLLKLKNLCIALFNLLKLESSYKFNQISCDVY